ncbi:L,D-transpeptidase [Ciceribacter sp. RN22]|uniref:L,D-transpeptidase n=1 Tax=Ciceribacter sp. RN22 TaxID=2954932 RepID=UPI002091ED6E|nr:L,D-transpeptidase [Ciceribacter sp. RN22]MCO6177489.1 L,D-transpeptidase [Ciceribacter sp. RN22]
MQSECGQQSGLVATDGAAFSGSDDSVPNLLLSRRRVLLGAGLLALGGCRSSGRAAVSGIGGERTVGSGDLIYSSVVDEGHRLPAVPFRKIKRQFLRRRVSDPTGRAPGTVVVDLANRFLYFVEPGGKAIRYGVGIGRDGFSWSGEGEIRYGRKWPGWTPPAEMLSRKPELAKYRGGMPGGIENPLGARALYIFRNGADTLYRVHGSPEWWTVGEAASSGCIRLINQDIIDLYSRVRPGARIVVG